MDTKLKKFRYSLIFKIIAWVICCASVFALSVVIVKMTYENDRKIAIFDNDYVQSNEYYRNIDNYTVDLQNYIRTEYDTKLKNYTLELINTYEAQRQQEIEEINNLGNLEDYSGNYTDKASSFEIQVNSDVATLEPQENSDVATNEPLEDFKTRKIEEINTKYGVLIEEAEEYVKSDLEHSMYLSGESIKQNKDFVYAIYDTDNNIIETNSKNTNAKNIDDLTEFDNVPFTGTLSGMFGGEIVFVDYMMTQDAILQNQKTFDYHKNISEYYVTLTVVLSIIGAVSFIWLLLLAGRKPTSDEVTVTKLDIIPNDIGAFIVIVTTAIGFIIVWMLYSEGFSYVWNYGMEIFSPIMVWIGITISAFVSFFLMWATSAAKRVKRKEKYLAIYMGVKGAMDAAKQAQISARYIWGFAGLIALGIFLIGTFVMALWYFNNEFAALIWFILLILYGVCVLRIILQKLASVKQISTGLDKIKAGEMDYEIKIAHDIELGNIADKINNISGGFKEAVEKEIKSERMKTELITNISHDIKTPLTSILTYVDLLKKQDVMGEEAKKYINVIDMKAQRLKILTEDLFEAAKATSGNIAVDMTKVELIQFIEQVLAEFSDKIEDSPVIFVNDIPDDKMYVFADGKLLFRVLSNVIDNALKYSMKNSRVYLSIEKKEENIVIVLKNISGSKLNITEEELMERFVRGDVSRHTEGSGLGLAIAKDFMKLMEGELEIVIDGDLFKVNIILKECID